MRSDLLPNILSNTVIIPLYFLESEYITFVELFKYKPGHLDEVTHSIE